MKERNSIVVELTNLGIGEREYEQKLFGNWLDTLIKGSPATGRPSASAERVKTTSLLFKDGLNPFGEKGGTRLENKKELSSTDLCMITTAFPKGNDKNKITEIPIHCSTKAALEKMIEYARRDGIKHPQLLPTSAYRSYKEQEWLWNKGLKKRGGDEKENARWVARPGKSPHQSGRAVDLWLGVEFSSKAEGIKKLKNQKSYQWLLKYAKDFGFYPYWREPWHWEFNPSGEEKRIPEVIKYYEEIVNKKSSAAQQAPAIPITSHSTDDFPYLDIIKAVRKNSQYAKSTGWESHRYDIYRLLGFTDITPTEELFAETIARWQKANGFTGKDIDGIIGPNTWARMKTTMGMSSTVPGISSGPLANITQVAANSDIARYRWRNRGIAPLGYIKGMALVYARMYCKYKAGDAVAIEIAKADTGNTKKDALAHYAKEFTNAGMSNASSGVDTLRHLFVLLIGLGMRESSGKYCEGRDKSASNTSAETAEAGLFQTSYNIRGASPLIPVLFQHYLAHPNGFLDVFKEGVYCKSSDLVNYGEGSGKEFQRLSKECPAFAAEVTAVGLRNRMQHWGPIKRKEAEIRQECDNLLIAIQSVVDQYNMCPLVKT